MKSRTLARKHGNFGRIGPLAFMSRLIRKKSSPSPKSNIRKRSRTAGATKRKFAKSRTKTRTNLQRDPVGVGQHSDMSTSFVRMSVPGKRKIGKFIGQYKYIHSVTQVNSGLEGTQSVFLLNSILSGFTLQGAVFNTRNALTYWAESIYALNPYANTSGSSTFPTQTSPPDVAYLNKVTGTLEFANLENVASEFSVYWCLCKKNIATDPAATWAYLLAAEQLGSAASAPALITSTTTATAGQGLASNPGFSPMRVRGWTELWKPLKIQRFIMEAGSIKKINFSIDYHKLIRQADILAMPSVAYLANYTITPMVINRGAVVGVFTAPSTSSTELTYARTKLGFLMNLTAHFSAIPTTRLQTTQTFLGNVANSTTTVENLINDLDAVATVFAV